VATAVWLSIEARTSSELALSTGRRMERCSASIERRVRRDDQARRGFRVVSQFCAGQADGPAPDPDRLPSRPQSGRRGSGPRSLAATVRFIRPMPRICRFWLRSRRSKICGLCYSYALISNRQNSGCYNFRSLYLFVPVDLLPNVPPFISRVCSGFGPCWGGLQIRSV
jgi:hypothetical protein